MTLHVFMVQFFVLEQKKLEISMGTPRLSSVAITELPRMLIKTGSGHQTDLQST